MSKIEVDLTNDAIDARIERRLAHVQDSIELRLSKAVDAQFKNHFESAVKLFGWTFALIALVFTLFGIKTAIDLREAAKSTAMEEVKKKLAIEDPNSEFRRDVDRVVARGIINSYFLEVARNKGEMFAPDVSVSDVDIQRLIDLLKHPKANDSDFRDAVEVLVRSNSSKRSNSIDRLLVALGNANEEQYKWMREQPEKRAALLELIREDKLLATARAAASDEKTEKVLILAAIRYLENQQDLDGVRILDRLTERADIDVSRQAVEALAILSPDSKVVSKALTISRDASLDSAARALSLAAKLHRSSNHYTYPGDPKQELRTSLASKVVLEAINQGFVFTLSSNFHDRKPGISLSKQGGLSVQYVLPTSLIAGQGSAIISRLIRESSNNNQTKLILRALCLADNEQCNGVVYGTFDGNSKVRLSNGLIIDSKQAPAGIYLRPASTASTAEILVSWTDQDAIRKTLVLDQLIDAHGMSFNVQSVRGLVDNAEQ